MNVATALALARQALPANEARQLLQHVLGVAAANLAAHPERELDAGQRYRYLELLTRRDGGEPVAYLLGAREFYGRDFHVSPAVLIPRPETELLVELAVDKLKGVIRPRCLDLGTGSGCVAVSLALELDAEVTAVDLSGAALAVAGDNARRLGATLSLVESDWFSALAGVFDLIVANPPYIAIGDAHLATGDLRFEPPLALACGADGLSAIRQIVADAPRHLTPGGYLFLEHGYDQAAALAGLLAAAGFSQIEQHCDLAGIVRVSGGRHA
jgi:release factor glutamine methyltransferase